MTARDECALDMQSGLDMFGWPDDEMPEAKPILARGGTVLMPCPICKATGRPHTLEVRQVDRHFVVIPVGENA